MHKDEDEPDGESHYNRVTFGIQPEDFQKEIDARDTVKVRLT